MAIAYFNCASGVAGDMLVGTFLDAGLPFKRLQKEIAKLPIGGYRLLKKSATRHWLRGTDFQVEIAKPLLGASPTVMRQVLHESRLPKEIKRWALKILNRVLKTQAEVFHLKENQLYFHRREAMDVLIDIVGIATGLDHFRFQKIYASPLPFHPCYTADVTAALQGLPLEKSQIAERLITITGISALKTVADHFGECPLYRIDKIGVGLGDLDLPNRANALRLYVGEGFPMVQCEANIDDMNPEWFDYIMKQLFSLGVVDVTLQPIQMKKNRPATLLRVIAPWNLKEKTLELILRETTTLGVRYFPVERKILTRQLRTVTTRFGKWTIKVAKDESGKIEKWIPEYETCRKVAEAKKIPLREVYEEILHLRHHHR